MPVDRFVNSIRLQHQPKRNRDSETMEYENFNNTGSDWSHRSDVKKKPDSHQSHTRKTQFHYYSKIGCPEHDTHCAQGTLIALNIMLFLHQCISNEYEFVGSGLILFMRLLTCECHLRCESI